MRRISVTGAIVVAGIACGASALAKGEPASHPFSFLAPALQLEALAPSTLAEGQVFVKVLPGRGNELAVVAATRTTAGPARLIGWMRRVDLVQRGSLRLERWPVFEPSAAGRSGRNHLGR